MHPHRLCSEWRRAGRLDLPLRPLGAERPLQVRLVREDQVVEVRDQ
jgi:hypothetical protein